MGDRAAGAAGGSGEHPPRRADARDLAKVLKSAATVAYAATSVDEAMRWALDLVCAYTGWPVGHIYRLDPEGGVLVPSAIWHLDDEVAYEPFVRASNATSFPPGVGLPGRILATGEPAWINDVRDDPNFPRAPVAVDCRIGAGFGFPITSSRGIEGVIEFFAPEPHEPDEELLDLLSHVGIQLGGVFDRARAQHDRDEAEAARHASEARLLEAQRLARLGSWSWSVADDTVVWSPEIYRIYGVDPEAGPLQYGEYLARVHPEDRPRVEGTVQQTMATLEPYEHEYRIVHPDGTTRWVHARGEVTERAGDVAVGLGGYCQDVTERKATEQRSRRAQIELASHQRILERVARGERVEDSLDLLCRDIEGRYPGARCSVLLVDDDEAVLRHVAGPSLSASFKAAIDGIPVGEGMAACGTAAARNDVVIVEDILDDVLTSAWVDVAREHDVRSVWSQPLTNAAGHVVGTFALYRSDPHRPDRSELRTIAVAGNLAALAVERDRTERALTAAASVDPLTGLPNRARFLDELAASLTEPGRRVAVMFLDLDRFKWINDSLGHPAGDRVLVDVARRLECALAGEHVVARFGGDEFTVLIVDAEIADVDRVADRIETALVEPFVLDGGEFFLSVSIGIAVNDHVADAYGLVRDADAAMYAAKDGGRARRARFDETLRERALTRVTTETELRRSIERDDFVMHYQPILDVRTRRWAGVEALVRWEHPARGTVLPSAFIPLAEETGLIVPLGLRILDHVMAQAAAWVADGLPTRIAANVSVVQLSDPLFASELAAGLRRHRLSPGLLSLEITESAVMDRFEAARAALEEIASSGTPVLIDDFGTGHSSIARLGELPVAGVKIDRAFVAPLGLDASAERVLAAMAELAHACGLAVVAEGIETTVALATVTALGCDYGQGFQLARPGLPDDVQHILRAAGPVLAG